MMRVAWFVVCLPIWLGLLSVPTGASDEVTRECSTGTTQIFLDTKPTSMKVAGRWSELHSLHHEYRTWLRSDRKRQRRTLFSFTNEAGTTRTIVVRFARVVAMAHRCEFDSSQDPSNTLVNLEVMLDAGGSYTARVEDSQVRRFVRAFDTWSRGGVQRRYTWGFKRQTGATYEKHGILVDFGRIAALSKLGGRTPSVDPVVPPCPPKAAGPGY